MTERPLRDRDRLFPLVDRPTVVSNNSDSDSEAEEEGSGTNKQYDDPILEQAETWYQGIAKEENKRKMMKNYLNSVTELSESEIEEKLNEAGV